jgi:hypothetical protein
MTRKTQDTSAEEPDGGNLQVRFRGGPGRGNQPGLLNKRVRNRENEAVTLTAAVGPRSSIVDERASIVRKGAARSVRLPRGIAFPSGHQGSLDS